MAGARDTAETPVRVILADDAAEMRSLLRWALEREAGVVVVGEAADSAEVMRLVAQPGVDIVVLDLQMPGVSAAELLEGVAAAAPSVPIVTFSGYEPELVAPDHAHLVRLHVPKTTDLALVRQAMLDVARGDR